MEKCGLAAKRKCGGNLSKGIIKIVKKPVSWRMVLGFQDTVFCFHFLGRSVPERRFPVLNVNTPNRFFQNNCFLMFPLLRRSLFPFVESITWFHF